MFAAFRFSKPDLLASPDLNISTAWSLGSLRSIPVYDLKGLNCPLPVLKARKRLAKMRPGARLWVETTDPLAAIDIPAFCNESGHELVETAKRDGGHAFLIRRRPAKARGQAG